MTDQLSDELLSINSIYEPTTLCSISERSSLYIFKLPARQDITVRLDVPQDYPDAPPSVLGTESTGQDVAKGEGQHFVDLLRNVLAEVFIPGSPCIFDLIEETTARLQQLGFPSAQSEVSSPQTNTAGQGDPQDMETSSDFEPQSDDTIQAAEWILSEVITEKKSVFVARAAHVESVEQAKQYLQHLLTTDKRVARATHNITAWRIQGANNVQYQDCDDDGETAAGGRLLHLLELMNAWNVMVVVTRWYGGVHLGPDRFRIINQVARDAVVKGGFNVEQGSKKKPKK